MFKSLRYRLLFWLLAFVLLTAFLLIPINSFFQKKKDKINLVVSEINSLNLQFFKYFKSSDNFLFIEPTNPSFYASGKSIYLEERGQLNESINKKFNEMGLLSRSSTFLYDDELKAIKQEFENYNLIFDSLVYLIYKHGYNNFGLEGEMIDNAAALEKTFAFDKIQLLQIRRNEKDYFLRRDPFYIENHNGLTNGLIEYIEKSARFSKEEKVKNINLINDYINSFFALVDIKNKIGLLDNSGLKYKLDQKSSSLEQKFSKLTYSAEANKKSLVKELQFFYITFISLSLILSVIISIFISRHILIHLEILTNYISKLTESNFSYNGKLELKNPSSEIRKIYFEFRNMVTKLRLWENLRDKALKEAEENELRYKELADMLPQSIYETDELGNFTYVNKAWHNNFGYTKEDLQAGLNLIETVISESKDDILGNIRLENSNFVAIRKDGSRFPASVYSDNFYQGDSLVGKRGIIIDITERNLYIHSLKKETFKAQNSDKLKSSFLANMSHEIRTPMNSIIGFSNLLASQDIMEEQKRNFVNYIKTSGEVLLNLIDDIIDIAKIEAGEIKINKKECNVNEMFNELYKSFEEIRDRSDKSYIMLKMNMNGNKNLTIKTDPFRLRQVLTNLINNALKFTDKGYIEFGFKIKNEKSLEFYVKDTGVGLSRDELGYIFERFKRSVHSEENNIVGTGLGLAISKNLVEIMGGEMWVDSSPGVGTTFFFTLPYLKTTIVRNDVLDYEMIDSYKWTDKTILVVEDDEQSFFFLNELLKKTGVNILRASNGMDAVEMVKIHPQIDAVLMDIQLPRMNGFEATAQIKRIKKSLPIIAQTAYAMSGDKEKCLIAGCDDYVQKPLNIEILLPKVNQYLFNTKENLKIDPSLHILRDQYKN